MDLGESLYIRKASIRKASTCQYTKQREFLLVGLLVFGWTQPQHMPEELSGCVDCCSKLLQFAFTRSRLLPIVIEYLQREVLGEGQSLTGILF